MSLGVEPLRLTLELGDHVGVEQLAQLDRAQQLAQQRRIDGQCRCPSLGQWRVALVHEGAHVAEQEVSRVRRRLGRLRLDEAYAPVGDLGRQTSQRREVVDVLQDLSQRLEDDGERRMPPRHLQQLRRALALLPERRALVGVHAGHQQRAGCALAEA